LLISTSVSTPLQPIHEADQRSISTWATAFSKMVVGNSIAMLAQTNKCGTWDGERNLRSIILSIC
jgi:hypothetical protein